MTLILFATIVLCPVIGGLAARKGYSFVLWMLSGASLGLGIIALLILASLPFVDSNDDDIEDERRKTGNCIGGVFTTVVLAWLILGLVLRSAGTSRY